MRNLHRRFVLCSASQIYDGDFAKFCGLLRIYELLTYFSFFYFRFLTKKANSSFPLVFLEKTRANFFILGKSLCSAIRVITSFATGEARGRECRSSAPWAILSDVSRYVLLTSLPDSQFLEKVLFY